MLCNTSHANGPGSGSARGRLAPTAATGVATRVARVARAAGRAESQSTVADLLARSSVASLLARSSVPGLLAWLSVAFPGASACRCLPRSRTARPQRAGAPGAGKKNMVGRMNSLCKHYVLFAWAACVACCHCLLRAPCRLCHCSLCVFRLCRQGGAALRVVIACCPLLTMCLSPAPPGGCCVACCHCLLPAPCRLSLVSQATHFAPCLAAASSTWSPRQNIAGTSASGPGSLVCRSRLLTRGPGGAVVIFCSPAAVSGESAVHATGRLSKPRCATRRWRSLSRLSKMGSSNGWLTQGTAGLFCSFTAVARTASTQCL